MSFPIYSRARQTRLAVAAVYVAASRALARGEQIDPAKVNRRVDDIINDALTDERSEAFERARLRYEFPRDEPCRCEICTSAD